jgi:hypothetical protein
VIVLAGDRQLVSLGIMTISMNTLWDKSGEVEFLKTL